MNEQALQTVMKTETREGLVKQKQCSIQKRVQWAEDVGHDGVADGMPDTSVDGRRGKEKQVRMKSAMARNSTTALSVISPITGAPHTNTFDLGNHSEAAELSHYITQTLFRHLFESPKERHAWFTVFQEYPILFHAFAHAAAVHADVLNNHVFLSSTPTSLAHKGRAMSLLNEALHHLDAANVEVLLIVMVTLATHDLEREGLVGGEMGFMPYVPDAYWMSVYGRLETIGQHLGAIGGLVGLVGGLGRIRLPGLANCLALTDMMVAGTNLVLPSFPCLWAPEPSILAQHSRLLSAKGQRPGKGFCTDIPGGLPPHTLAVLVRLATIDRYMANHCGRPMADDAYRRMMNTRNSLHHAVLSLPAWSDLPEDERALAKDCKEPFYEAARLAAVIYSCAVIYGLPPHRDWHLKRASELRRVIEGCPEFANEAWRFLLWVVCVGALAALRSPERLFFEGKLGEVVGRHEEVRCFENAATVLDDFIWSQRACEDGMEGLWRPI